MRKRYRCPLNLPDGSKCGFECDIKYEAVQHNQWHLYSSDTGYGEEEEVVE
tara:strand:+ start:1725 stop:1877 length:153 start_codon:yes stop_codon:yes gene_type:complete